MTQTPRRRRLIPRSAIIASAVIVVLVAGAVVASALVTRSRLVPTPDVSGLPNVVAQETIEGVDLVHEVEATRVSVNVPAGSIVSQEPIPGTLVPPGSTVRVIVSAGPQTFLVPDLVGSSVDGAKSALEALGFVVVIETDSSETTEAVVLEMFPAPGASLGAGDEIRLTIPGGAASESLLLPYDLSGLAVLLDPGPTSSVSGDTALEVARRLQALLEAAGATVSTTRTGATQSSVTVRADTARTSSAAILVGIDVGATGAAGVTVSYAETDGARDAREFAAAITRAATLPGIVVNEPSVVDDPVLQAFARTGVRVTVGDETVSSDVQHFSDPTWADQIARAIYRGLGTTLTSS